MSNYTLVKDDEVPDGVIIPDDSWALKIGEAIVVINSLKFADKPNKDGTMNCLIDYDVPNLDDINEDDIPENFDTMIGDIVLEMLETSLKVSDMKEALKE